jgi:hypothetical protein
MLVEEAAFCLRRGGLQVEVLQRFETFARLHAAMADGEVVVDLVAQPAEEMAGLVEIELDGLLVRLPSEEDLLAGKPCALFSRSELRDPEDVLALLARGHSLAEAAARAPRYDGGLSPLQLAWLLRRSRRRSPPGPCTCRRQGRPCSGRP